ncbi:MAG: HD domain-containing protein [Synergistales bacterium]|nr:HD domain-containing protein [Synergistales bacterium]
MRLRRILPTILFLFGGLAAVLLIVGVAMNLTDRIATFRQSGDDMIRHAASMLSLHLEEVEKDATLAFLQSDTPLNHRRGGHDEIRILALLEGGRVVRTLAGGLPLGIRLPHSHIAVGQWSLSDRFNPKGEPLLERSFPVGEDRLLHVGVRPAFKYLLPEVEGYGISLLVIDEDGDILWPGPEQENVPGFLEPSLLRGKLERSVMQGSGWRYARLATGRRLWVRPAPTRVENLRIVAVLPLQAVLLSLVKPVVPLVVLLLLLLLLLWTFLLLFRRRILPELDGVTSLAAVLPSRLQGVGDPESMVEVVRRFSQRFREQRGRSSVAEVSSMLDGLTAALDALQQQQEEIVSYNEELKGMNDALEGTNNTLRMREHVWGKTLEVTRELRGGAGLGERVNRVAEAVREVSGAFGVTIDLLRDEQLIPLGWSGYRVYVLPAPATLYNSLAGKAVRQRRVIWAEDVEQEESYMNECREVKSELVIPLVEEDLPIGSMEIDFDEPRARDEELIETLDPVAANLTGTLYAVRAQEEIRASYTYLAGRLQHLTSIYHDETAEHIDRVGAYSRLLARALGREGREVEDMGVFAKLHDIGKLKVPREILSKPGPLTEEEFAVIKMHPQWGAKVLGEASWLAMARRICLYHHEKWDGSGYPYGLAGEDIPWEGQVVTLADIYDALRGARAYKPAFSHEKTTKIITEGDGRVEPHHFNPVLLEYFREHHELFAAVYEKIQG